MSLFDQFENESTQPSQFAATARRQSTNPPAQPLILEQGYVSIRPQTQLLPIFSLDRVQFPFPFVNLVSLAVSSNILLLVAESGSNSSRKDGAGQRLYRIDLGKSDAIDEIEPGLRQRNDKIRRVFLDPTAKHLLFSTEMGDNYYLYHHWRKPRVLNKFRGVLIESVAWGKSGSAGGVPTTGVILVGSRQGHVFEAELQPTDEFFKREEKYFRQVYSIPENNTPINSIRFEQFPAVPNKYVVFLSSPSRLYQFIGNVTDIDSGSMFTDLFRKYDGPGNSFQEMPGESLRGELQFWCQFVQATGYPGVPKAFAWLTGSGLYCGDLVFGNQSGGDSIVNNAQLLPYPRSNESSRSNSSTDGPYAPGEVPISVNITEFHFLLLYENYFKAINNLTNQVDHEEQIPLEFGEYVVGLFVDPIKSTYWISTNLALYELIMTEEDRDVWRIYLDRKSFDTALSHAKTPAHKDIVITAQAEYYYSQKRYMLSATYYAQCASLSFEEIVLKFIDKDERGALHQYLLQKLGRLRPQDSTQITLISTWLVEIFINKLNILHDELRDASVLVDTLSKDVNVDEASEQAKSERKRLEEEEAVALDEFRQFLQKYKARLDLDTTSNIIASHGRVQELLYFLELMGNFEKVVTYWIQEQEWLKALGALARQPSSDLYYKFSPVLMDHAPYETVNSWIRQPNLNPRNLIPALLRYQVRDRNQGKQGVEGQNQAIRYLTYVTQKLQNTDTAVHNLLLSLYISQAKHNDDQELLQYLSSQRENPYYDQRYALRLCSQHGLPQACVVLYGAMGMHEQAVDLALQLHDLELAQINADKPEDDELLRRKLWLKIARHVVEEKRDIKQALAFLTQTADLLKIEDILPFFPDFVLIDDFKEEICVALENYNEHIEELKAEMDEATKSAESIRLDIRDLRNRYTAIPVTEECNICNAALLTRQFYVYPCEHVFHADCLTDQTIKNSNPTKAKRVKDLQRRITQGVAARRAGPATDEGGINLASAMLAMRLGKPYEAAIEPAAVKTEVLKEELDDLIAAECPLCGDLMIKSVDRPFVDATEMELIRSWEL